MSSESHVQGTHTQPTSLVLANFMSTRHTIKSFWKMETQLRKYPHKIEPRGKPVRYIFLIED